MSENEESPVAGAAPSRRLYVGVALVSAAVLLLQLVQTRIFSVMMFYHLTYLVVTFTLLGFAAGGAVLACRPRWLEGNPAGKLAGWSVVFGLAAVASYAIMTRSLPDTAHAGEGIATAAIQYGVLVIPMIFAGMVVALALSAAGASVGRMYAWNMGGSALGCAIYVPVLTSLGGEGAAVFAAALAFVGAAAFAPTSRGRVVAYALAIGGLGVSLFKPTLLFEVPMAPDKFLRDLTEFHEAHPELPPLTIELVKWDPLCRLDVIVEGAPDDPLAQRTIFQDGDAPTRLPMGDAQYRQEAGVKEGLAYPLFANTAPKVLAIGIGGGLDILLAKLPRKYPDGSEVEFTGVEINRTTYDLMVDRYREMSGNRYFLPGVTIHNDEGRSWLRRSQEKYDIIQMSGIDTYAALSSGSYIMSESYLYTVEAYDDFLAHLTDEGVISVTRYRFEPPRENLRLAAIATEALRRSGVERPENHVMVIGVHIPYPEGHERALNYGALLIRKRPFTAAEVDLYKKYCEFDPTYFLMHAPGFETKGPVADYFRAVAAQTDEQFRRDYLYNLDPATDDNPFFFRYHKWSGVWSHLLGRTTDDAPKTDAYTGIVGGKPIGLMMLITVLTESFVLVVLLVLVPLLLFRREGLRAPNGTKWLLYFTGLGAGYILIEVVAMQRFVLFLGHPGYAITVVLITFLIFSALGAAVAGRSDDPRRTLRRALIMVLVLIATLGVGLPSFFDAFLMIPLAARIALTVVILAVPAFFMGMPFPSGLALLRERSSPMIPWAFGVNGGASVLASIAGIMIAMGSGFSLVFVVAGLMYLTSYLAGRRA